MQMIEAYEQFKYYERQAELIEDFRWLLQLNMAEIEFDLKSIKVATDHIENVLQNLQIEVKSLSRIIKLSVYLNRFEVLVEACRNQYLEFESEENFEIKVFVAYMKWRFQGICFPVKSFCLEQLDEMRRSLLAYLIALVVEEASVKQAYLQVAYENEPSNLSAVYELMKYGPVTSLKTLKQLYQNQEELLVHIPPKRPMDLKFTALGGGEDIGANCYLLQLGEKQVLIDAGLKLGKTKNEMPDFEKLESLCPMNELNIVLLTHAHLDHCGALLDLFQRNKKLIFIMTRATKALLKINLAADKSSLNPYLLEELLQNCIVLEFNQPKFIKKLEATIEFFRAGHILGAASILIQSKAGNVFVTGDYCIDEQHTVKGLALPQDLPIDLLITETTYGDKKEGQLASKKQVEAQLVSYVVQKINEGKKVLIPAFAIGRAQELICLLKQEAVKHSFRLYVDGLVGEVNEIYKAHSKMSFEGKNVYQVPSYGSKTDFIEQEFLNNRSCVIASSGMLEEGSTSCDYMKHLVQRKDGVCILTGYQAAGTVGSRLKEQMDLNCERYLAIEDQTYGVQCELNEFNLSAHCSIADILAVVTHLKPQKVVLVHGSFQNEKSYIHELLEQKVEVLQSYNNQTLQIKEA